MDRGDAEEGSAPKRHKLSHHRPHHHRHQGRGAPGEAASAEVRVGTAQLASGKPGEGAIALDEGAATADVGRALAPAPEPDNNCDANLARSPRSQRVKVENHKDADFNDPKSREEVEEKFELLVAKLGGSDPEKHKVEGRKRTYVTPKKDGKIQLQKQQQEIVCCSNSEGTSSDEKTTRLSGLGEDVPMCERSEDIFVDVIFGESPIGSQKLGACTKEHFEQDFNYFHEKDPVTRMTVKRHPVINIKRHDVSSLDSSFPGEDPKMLSNFNDLLKKILVLDPEKRLKVEHALSHPFVSGR